MSTRSGKRIHNSPDFVLEAKEVKTERKTRSKKQKENCEVEVESKKKHYVLRCPSEEEASSDANSQIAVRTRKSRRTTLKEVTNNDEVISKAGKTTRRKKTVKDDIPADPPQKTSKKSKKKRAVRNVSIENEVEVAKRVVKKKTSSGSVVIEDLYDRNLQNASLNKSASVDSFHSAAGSHVGSPEPEAALLISSDKNILLLKDPKQITKQMEVKKDGRKNKRAFRKRQNSEEEKNNITTDMNDINMDEKTHNESAFNLLFDSNRKSRSSYKNSTFNELSSHDMNSSSDTNINTKSPLSSNFNKSKDTNCRISLKLMNTSANIPETIGENKINNLEDLNKTSSKRNSDLKITNAPCSEVQVEMNTTFDKETPEVNTTYEKDNNVEIANKKSNLTLKNISTRKSFIKTNTPNKDEKNKINSTFEKEINTKTKDITTENPNTLNSTFEKPAEISKSSIITSDESNNEKSVSRISITSDESRTENIVNTTPLLIESSLDESQIKKVEKEISKSDKESTPVLQREGTFTKESPKTPSNELRTSPGRTPFPSSKRSSTKKAVLNVTRSIEKPRAVDHPRATRVMFCSPVNTPMVTNQIKGKVIKSSMKGSNKSFVFDEKVGPVGSARKRSYTQSDADELDVKRLKVTNSTKKEARSRTSSASGKIQNTPTKSTPSKEKPDSSRVVRKKLPNFAALHQKQFDKMESLDECQERKAKRAQMLAAGTTLDKDVKTDTKQDKKHTLLSINPGYTRFGFRMKSDVNPFNSTLNTTVDPLNTTNIPNLSKTVVKSKELPNGLKRQATLPSLTGSTRKEKAKQTIMREKSLVEKRNAIRKENRTIIKGVRTNRRFELQMQMRNIN